MCKELVRLTTEDVGKAIPITDSITISIRTGIKEDSIKDSIKRYKNDLEEFGNLRFEIGDYGKYNYLLNEGQATFLMTLLRNKPAVLKFKKDLVKAFVFMKNELQVRQGTRHIGIKIRKSLTDTINNKVDDNTSFKKFSYSNYTKLVYKKILGKTVKKVKESRGLKKTDNLRNFLSIEELEKVQDLESKIAFYIEMRKDLDNTDKEIYQEVKKYIEGLH